MAKPTKPLTLGDCVARKIMLEVMCLGCLHRKQVDPAPFALRFGADYRVPNLNGKLKCSMCTSSHCQVTPATSAVKSAAFPE
jgi:hypothetical protein